MRQIIIVIALFALMHLVSRTDAQPTAAPFDTQTLIATGFILVTAYALGELFRRLRLPALLGYLAAGVLFGPSLAALVYGHVQPPPLSAQVLQELSLVNLLAIGVIGTMGGGELKISDLRESLPKIMTITFMTFILVLPAIGGLVFGLTVYAPQLVPFLADLPVEGRIAGALLLGVLAVGMSPSATLALLQEVRAHGRFTNLVLGTVVFADLVLVATFLLALALAKLLISAEGFSSGALATALPVIATEFGWAILLGVIVGLLFIAYLRLVGREVLLFSLAVIFATSFVASRLHAETLLAFLVAGFVVQNFSRHGHTLIHAFERIALPVFVIYFATQAAALDLVAVTVYLPLTLLLVLTRGTLFYFGVGVGARLGKVDDRYRRTLQMSFFSQGGVDLVLAALIAESIPGWGASIQTVTMATVLFYIVGGPPLLARALDAVGESAAARERGAENLSQRSRGRGRGRQEHPVGFAEPIVTDGALGRRLTQLRDVMRGVADSVIHQTVADRGRRRGKLVTHASRMITAALEFRDSGSITGGVPPKEIDAAEVRRRLAAMDEVLVQAGRKWDDPAHAPFDVESLGRMLDTLMVAEAFATTYRVTRESHLFDRQGHIWQRLLRAARRVRRFVFGPGMRTVPTGRLWRYHVAFEVPVGLWGVLRPNEAQVWHALLEHYRFTRLDLDGLLVPAPAPDFGTTSEVTEPPGFAGSGEQAKVAEHADEAPAPSVSPAARLEAALDRAGAREREILVRVAEDERTEHELLQVLVEAWQSFLTAVELAGTLELPTWRYRLSTKYDTAQAAKAELRERIEHDRHDASGRRDAASAMVHGYRVASWTHEAAHHAFEKLDARIHDIVDRLDIAVEHCRALRLPPAQKNDEDAAALEPAALFDTGPELKSALEEIIRDVYGAARSLEVGQSAARDRDRLDPIVHDIPAVLAPTKDIATPPTGQGEVRRITVRLQDWLRQVVAREFTVAALELEETVEGQFAIVGTRLHHASQVLEYHITSASTTMLEVDRGLGERLETLLEKSREELVDVGVSTRKKMLERVEQAAQRAVDPLAAGRWDEVRRALRLEDRMRTRDLVGQWVREHRDVLAQGIRRRARRLADEVAALFDERSTPAEAKAFRSLVFERQSAMPDVYQRLFTSVPAESLGLIIPRPELEHLRRGVEQWLSGRAGAALVCGDRGAGKRTLVRQLAAEIQGQLEVKWIRLDADLQTEPDIAAAIARAAQWPPAPAFLDLSASARAAAGWRSRRLPVAIVLENAEQLFRRTSTDLARTREFFDLVAATSDDLLWIVLMVEPAARLLTPMVDLRARFSTIVEVAPLDVTQLEQMLSARHRLSGYGLKIEYHTPSIQEWLRGPASAWRLFRKTREAIYDRLRLLSGGNARQSLQLWLAAARPDPKESGMVVVGPIEAMPSPLLERASLSGRLLLATLLLHGPLNRAILQAIHGVGTMDIDVELGRLIRMGLVEPKVRMGPGMSEPLMTVPTRAIAPLTEELRRCNLL